MNSRHTSIASFTYLDTQVKFNGCVGVLINVVLLLSGCLAKRVAVIIPRHPNYDYLDSLNNSRPISILLISDVPAPISYSLASRSKRPVGYSLM